MWVNGRTSSQSSSEKLTAGARRWMPAQLTRMWILLSRRGRARSTTVRSWSRSAMSHSTNECWGPEGWVSMARRALSVAIWDGSYPGRTTKHTEAPAFARARAHAWPMPLRCKQRCRNDGSCRTSCCARDEDVLSSESEERVHSGCR
jgi:hypothetical protein